MRQTRINTNHSRYSYKKVLSGPLGQVLPFFIGVAALLSIPTVADASVQITQVMYDVEGADTGREWIKITNTGSEAVDVSSFRLLEAGVHHKLKVVQGGALLAPGTSAIIADNAGTFLGDTPGYVGILFDSAFSLSNSGETLMLKDAARNIEHSYSYTAPVVEKPVPKKVTTSTKQTTSTATTSSSSRVKFEGSSQSATVASPVGNLSPGLLASLAGLGSLIALGVAGALFARQERGRKGETKDETDEFTIINT